MKFQVRNSSRKFLHRHFSFHTVIRSSTSKIQDVYSKAKDKSPLIRLPCHLAETVADKSLKIARTVADPLVKPFQRPGKNLFSFSFSFVFFCRPSFSRSS